MRTYVIEVHVDVSDDDSRDEDDIRRQVWRRLAQGAEKEPVPNAIVSVPQVEVLS